jgi:RimJ/RimL family protein N-acetyltransferase
VSHPLATAVCTGEGLEAALDALALRAGRGWPHEDTADGLRPLAEHGAAGGDGGWLVTVDGEVVGDLGWRGGADAGGDVVLGYGLAAPYRGQGLGTEAVAVLCAWAERQPGVQRLVADVHLDNEPSRRLLRRLGFREDVQEPPWVRCVRGPEQAPRIRGKHVC